MADIGVAVFVVSTFETDYVLVKQLQFAVAVSALQRAGHRVITGLSAEPV
jgi:hypothetical protein